MPTFVRRRTRADAPPAPVFAVAQVAPSAPAVVAGSTTATVSGDVTNGGTVTPASGISGNPTIDGLLAVVREGVKIRNALKRAPRPVGASPEPVPAAPSTPAQVGPAPSGMSRPWWHYATLLVVFALAWFLTKSLWIALGIVAAIVGLAFFGVV